MQYDAIIIGSGQAGNPLWDSLTDPGWTVALIENAHLGGTCINTGCTPTKTLVASAQIAYDARNAARWGVHAGAVSVDLPRIVARKDAIVRQFRVGRESLAASRNALHLHRGLARFVSPTTVAVGETVMEGKRIFINAGSRPAIPRIDGLDQVGYLTDAGLLELPDHLLVLGAGTSAWSSRRSSAASGAGSPPSTRTPTSSIGKMKTLPGNCGRLSRPRASASCAMRRRPGWGRGTAGSR